MKKITSFSDANSISNKFSYITDDSIFSAEYFLINAPDRINTIESFLGNRILGKFIQTVFQDKISIENDQM